MQGPTATRTVIVFAIHLFNLSWNWHPCPYLAAV